VLVETRLVLFCLKVYLSRALDLEVRQPDN
jgi:hypothetical protein